MNHNVCIVAIAKGEHNYIIEFLHYHLSLGFDKVVLYDNEDVPTYYDLIAQTMPELLTCTHVIHFPHDQNLSQAVQYRALSHFMAHFKNVFTHVLHIDIDEFLVLKKHPDIKSFIHEWMDGDPQCAGVCFNWKLYGDAGLPSPFPEDGGSGDFSQVMRFLHCQHGLHPIIKTLFRTDQFRAFRTVHDIRSRGKTYVISADTLKRKIKGPYYETHDDSIAQLNHYKPKTWAEFTRTWRRGRADVPLQSRINQKRMIDQQTLKPDLFEDLNKNETIDTSARDFYARHRH